MRTFVVVACLSVFLAGCGGGGGGDGDGPVDEAVYTGVTTQTSITETNAKDLALGALYGGPVLNTIDVIQPSAMTNSSKETVDPGVLKYSFPILHSFVPQEFTGSLAMKSMSIVPVSDSTPGNCGGLENVNLKVDDASGGFNGTLEYESYCEDGTTLSGLVHVGGVMDISTMNMLRMNMSFTSLTMSSGGESVTMSGSYAMTTMAITMSHRIRDNATNKVYKIENYTITETQGIDWTEMSLASGRYYHPDYGYVEVNSLTPFLVYLSEPGPRSGELQILGANGTKALLTALSTTQYEVAADIDGDGTYEWSSGPLRWSDVNTAPIANAGPDQNVTIGSTVQLDGSGSSDSDGDLLRYSWSFTSKPAGSNADLSDSSAVQPTFITDFDGTYVLSLVVDDGLAGSTPDSVTVTAATGNSVPVANAGIDQNVTTGSTVTLDGSASSDADGDLLSYSWTFTSIPAGSAANLSDSSAVNPTFVADLDGIYVLTLVVDDGLAGSATDSVTVTAATGNSIPIANAGVDQSVTTGSIVTLDGSASSDADGDPLSYRWTFISMPPGSSAVLSDSTAVMPTFVADLARDYVIGLVVNDGTTDSLADVVTVTVTSTFGFGADYIQYRSFEVGTPVFRYFLPMTKDGSAIQPATDILSVILFDSLNNPMTPMAESVSLETYMSLNCLVQPCVPSGPIIENGFWGNFNALPADTYRFEVSTFDGQTLNLIVPYPGQLVLPVILSGNMQSSWVGSDLLLNWTNPVGETNWAEVVQLRIRLFDENGVAILYIRLDPSAESVTISGSLLAQAIALGNGTLASWEIQTRAYDSNNMNYARGISSRVPIPVPGL